VAAALREAGRVPRGRPRRWFDLSAAREAVVPAQRRFIDDLVVVAGGA